MPVHELPKEPEKEEIPEGTNATIHRPDPNAEKHPVDPDRKPRGPYVTGNS
jgi:hypothetical protein